MMRVLLPNAARLLAGCAALLAGCGGPTASVVNHPPTDHPFDPAPASTRVARPELATGRDAFFPIVLSAELPARNVRGGPIPLTLALTNTTDHLVLYGSIAPYCIFDLDLYDDAGQWVPPTQAGGGQVREPRGGSSFSHPIPPGESARRAYDLAALFDIRRDGTYHLRARRWINDVNQAAGPRTRAEIPDVVFTVTHDEP